MQHTFVISTDKHDGLFDITELVRRIVRDSGTITGMVNVYVRGATAAVMIQENWDESVRQDVIDLLKKLIPGCSNHL